MQELAIPETIHPQKVNGGLSFRIVGSQVEEYLNGYSLAGQVKKFFVDWQAFRNGLADWNFWRPPAVAILVDDGLGMKGACSACGYPHISVYPVGVKPPQCAEAVKVPRR